MKSLNWIDSNTRGNVLNVRFTPDTHGLKQNAPLSTRTMPQVEPFLRYDCQNVRAALNLTNHLLHSAEELAQSQSARGYGSSMRWFNMWGTMRFGDKLGSLAPTTELRGMGGPEVAVAEILL